MQQVFDVLGTIAAYSIKYVFLIGGWLTLLAFVIASAVTLFVLLWWTCGLIWFSLIAWWG